MPPIKLVASLTQICINCLSAFFTKYLLLANAKVEIINNSKSEFNQNELDKICASDLDPSESPPSLLNHQDKKTEDKSLLENQLEILKCFLLHLAQDITGHGHCHLQELTFWSILKPLNHLYNKTISKEIKKLMREIVPLFVNSSLRTLDLGSFKMFSETSMFEAIYARLNTATNLEKLVFGRSCYWHSNLIEKLNDVLANLSNLRVLHIKYICQPEMLHCLPQSCPNVQELSLEGSRHITNEEVPILAQFVNIHTLNISGTSITGKGCQILVLELPHLTWLTHCPFNCNSDVLIFESRAAIFSHIRSQILIKNKEEIEPKVPHLEEVRVGKENVESEDKILTLETSYDFEKPEEPPKLKLKNFWLFNSTTEELLLTHLCPDLEHLRLDFVIQDLGEVPEIEPIKQLSQLTSLALYTYDICPIQLVTNVIESTNWLTTLHLHLGDEWFFVAPIVNTISQFCQNLIYLTMEGDYKGQHPLEEADARLDFSLSPCGLCHLKEAKLAGCVSDARIMHLLIQAPNLHLLHVDGELEWLHDDTFTSAIRQNLLLQLKVLWFNVSGGVTFATIRRLLQCENNLQRVGRLCLMSSASKEGYHDLLRLVKRLNLATELIWVTDQRELKGSSTDSNTG